MPLRAEDQREALPPHLTSLARLEWVGGGRLRRYGLRGRGVRQQRDLHGRWLTRASPAEDKSVPSMTQIVHMAGIHC